MKKVFVFFASFSIVLILFCYYFHPITNLVGDLAFYLKTGEIIVTTHSIPSINLFSYTNSNFPFINPNWLSEVVFFRIQKWFGFSGLILLSTGLGIAGFGTLLLYALKKYDSFTTLFLSLLSLQVLYERTDVKPELFSYILLSLFLVILYRYREKFTRWIFFLILLMFVWVNLHIYFFIGIAVLFFFVIDAVVTNRKDVLNKKNKILFLVTLLCCLVTCINPQFVKGALYPLFVTQNYAFPVEENINFFTAISSYQDTTFFFFGLFATLLIVSLIASFKKLKPVDVLLGLFFTIVGFAAVRAFPLFILGIFLPLIRTISYWSDRLWKKTGKYTLYIQSMSFVCLLLILLPTIIFNMQNNHGIGVGVQDDAKNAIMFIKQYNLHGPFYNNFDIGDYLEYALYSQEKVFVDARAEAYPKPFFEKIYFPSQKSTQTFDLIAKQYKFQTAIIAHSDSSEGNVTLIQNLYKNPLWTMVYVNNSIVIFVKNTSSNSLFTKQFRVTPTNIHLTKGDIDTKQHVLQLANFFRILGWDKQWLEMSERYLDFEPTNCGALENVAYLFQQQKSPNTQAAINKYVAQCVPQSNL